MDDKDKQVVDLITQALQLMAQARDMMATEDQGENEAQAQPVAKKGSMLARAK